MAAPWLDEGTTSFSRRAITVVLDSPRVEPWVTAGSRAVGKEALPRSCIATPSSTTCRWEYLERGRSYPSADVPLDYMVVQMFLFVNRRRSSNLGGAVR